MKYTLKVLFLILLAQLSTSCGDEYPNKEISYYVGYVEVENHSENTIYPTVYSSATEKNEYFGVVSPGKSASKGGGGFKIGGNASVKWEETERNKYYSVEIDTSSILDSFQNAKGVIFEYKGSKIWVVKVLDADFQILAVSKQSTMVN